jgi:GNAT superfamily N-acetyltransferase
MHNIDIQGYIPGAIGRITEMHARYYSKAWGFGPFFEAKVATELSEFIDRFDTDRDGIWTVCIHDRVEGAIVIDGVKADTQGAHLRWYILSSCLRGQGFGNKLLLEALEFCRLKSYDRIYLWTFKGLEAARHLYEKNGFKLAEAHEGCQWGTTVVEQKFIRGPSS